MSRTALALICTLISIPTLASEPARVAVMVMPSAGSEDGARLVEEALLDEALAHSADEQAWLLVAFSRAAPPLSPQAATAKLAELAQAGKKAYRYLKLDEAEATFEQAAGLLRTRPLTRCDAEQLAEMYLYWARAVLDGGDEIGAQVLLGQIQRFDPKAGPDPAVMPPNLVAAFDLALDDRRGRPAGRVLFQSGPSAATTYVNCQELAAGVVEYAGVAGDELWVAAEVTGGTFANRFVLRDGPRRRLIIHSGQPGEPAQLAERFDEIVSRSLSISALTGKADADLDAVAALLGVPVLLLAERTESASGPAVRMGLYAAGSGQIGQTPVIPLSATGHPDSDKLVRAVTALAEQMRAPSMLAALTKDLTASAEPDPIVADTKPGPTPPGDEADAGPVWWQTWWFWTAVGVVVVGGAAAGTGVALTSGNDKPSGKVVLSIVQP